MTQRLSSLIASEPRRPSEPPARPVLGVLPGEGIGPEVVGACLRVLAALEAARGCEFEIRTGGAIGGAAESQCGQALSEDVVAFCRGVFEAGGAVLAGPGGGRFVYDLRKRFDLFCKLSPLVVVDELQDASFVRPDRTRGVDILVVRENLAGVYQGQASEEVSASGERTVQHHFSYSQGQVQRIVGAAARIARARRGELAVVVKQGGLPRISRLWRECSQAIAREVGVRCSLLDVDYAAYCLVQQAPMLDVMVAPNLFGDILCDVGGLLLGSRALSYGGSFSSCGCAVYQTNHGAAWDLAGSDRANPAGQILSLAMALRESYGLEKEAELVERALRAVWREGWRTDDLATRGSRRLGTREMGERVAEGVASLADGCG